MHVEDRLQEIYFKSRMLSEYMKTCSKADVQHLAAVFGFVNHFINSLNIPNNVKFEIILNQIAYVAAFRFSSTDLPLILGVAGTHSPHFSLAML